MYGPDGVVAVGGNYIIKLKTAGGIYDSSFAGFGYFQVPGSAVNYNDILNDGQNRFLITGMTDGDVLFLSRILANGTVDPAFQRNRGAYAVKADSVKACKRVFTGTRPFPSRRARQTNRLAGRLAIQADGKIVQAAQVEVTGAVRCTLTRFLKDGAIDQEFGENGRSTLPVDGCSVRRVAVQPDGRILIGGTVLLRIWN